MNDRRKTPRPASRAGLLATGLALLLVAPPHADVRGQAQVGSGHALDANLRIGSGGYNGAVRGGGGRVGGSYGARGSRAFRRSSYNAIRNEAISYNTFQDERAYSPNRWHGGRGGGGGGDYRINSRAGVARSAPPPSSAGFSTTYDSGYEAGLAAGAYESKSAQQQADTLSYGIGFALGEEVRAVLDAEHVEADLPTIITGFRHAVQAEPARMSDEEMEELLHALYERITGVQTSERLATDPDFKAEYDRNVESARELRDRLAKDAEVVTLDNGLQYRVLVEGTGPTPSATDVVSVRYSLLKPTGEAVTEPLRQKVFLRYTLEGFHIALTTMKIGDVWQIAIPSSLAHGVNGRPPSHGPGSTLYFEVELVSIH